MTNTSVSYYNKAKQSIFDFTEEIVHYCKNDVAISRACLMFRKMFIKCGSVCFFKESTTI